MTLFRRPSTPALAGYIVLAFFLLATAYSVVTPIFESPDELWHYPFVWHLARGGRLPVQNPNAPALWAQEGSQPPLYYVLAALLTSPIPADDLPTLIYRNPHADLGRVTADGNINIVVHTPRERWPWRGAVLAIHLTRLFSALLGAGTVLTVYKLGRTIWPDDPAPALLATTFVAFNPMFLFIAGSVNNDNLITLLASLTLWRLARLVVAPQPPLTLRPYAELGILTGLAALSKVSGLGLLGLVGLTLLWQAVRRRQARVAIVGNGVVSLLSIAVAGWWYWRNITLYGDWTGAENMVKIMGPRTIEPTPAQLLAEIPGLLRSFWGLFGYFSVPLPAFLYSLLNLLLALGLVGLAAPRLPWRGHGPTPQLRQTWPLMAGWIGLMVIGLVQWTLRTPATQGRLLFPAIAALAVLWSAGWTRLWPLPRGWALPAVGLFGLAVWVPWGIIAPAYALPQAITDFPPSVQPLETTFGDSVQLLGYQTPTTTVSPGDTLPLTLYWRGNRPVGRDYTLFVHLLDEYHLVIAQRDLFHGPGVYPTSQWTPGLSFADTYVLTIPRQTFAPTQARFEVGLYDHTSGTRLPVSTGGDSLTFDQIEIVARPGEFPNPQTLRFEDNITLAGYNVDQRLTTPGQEVSLTLYWQSQGQPGHAYKVFVHLVGPDGRRVAQHDAVPVSGWSTSQTIADEHPLSIAPDAPPGAYRLIVGLYRPDTGQRLRLLRDGTIWQQTDSVTLGALRIIAP